MEQSNGEYCLPPLWFDRSGASPDLYSNTPNQATVDGYLSPAQQQGEVSPQNSDPYPQSPLQGFLSPLEPSVYSRPGTSSYAATLNSFVAFPEDITYMSLENSVHSAAEQNVALTRSEEDVYAAQDRLQCGASNYATTLSSFVTSPENITFTSLENGVYLTPENVRLPRSEEDIYAAQDRLYPQTEVYSDLQSAEYASRSLFEAPQSIALPPSPLLEDGVLESRPEIEGSVYSQSEYGFDATTEDEPFASPQHNVHPAFDNNLHSSLPVNNIDGTYDRRYPQPRVRRVFSATCVVHQSVSQSPQHDSVSASPSILPPLPDSPNIWPGFDYHTDSPPLNPSYTAPFTAVDTPVQTKSFSNQVDPSPPPLPPVPKASKRGFLSKVLRKLCYCDAGSKIGWSGIVSPTALRPVPISPASRSSRPSRPTSQALPMRTVRPYRSSGERLRRQTVDNYGWPGWSGYTGCPDRMEPPHPHHPLHDLSQEDLGACCNDGCSPVGDGDGCQDARRSTTANDRRDDPGNQCASRTEDTHDNFGDHGNDAGNGDNDIGNDHGDIGLDCGDTRGHDDGGGDCRN